MQDNVGAAVLASPNITPFYFDFFLPQKTRCVVYPRCDGVGLPFTHYRPMSPTGLLIHPAPVHATFYDYRS